jgi:hypothetical protein
MVCHNTCWWCPPHLVSPPMGHFRIFTCLIAHRFVKHVQPLNLIFRCLYSPWILIIHGYTDSFLMNSHKTNSSVWKKQKPPSKNLKAFLMFETLSVTFMWTDYNTVSSITISVSAVVNEHSYWPTPYPASYCLLARRIASQVCFTSPNGTTHKSISTMTYFPSTSMMTYSVIPSREIPFSPLSNNWTCHTHW